MILKIFKAVWFLSVLAVLVNLLFVYASLPEEVIVRDEDSGRLLANREFLFYAFIAVLLLVNVLVYGFKKVFPLDDSLRTWFHGLVITINIFFIVALNLVQVYNSAEKFDFTKIGFVIYASVYLMIAWALSWPLYRAGRKIMAKQAVS